MMHPCHEIVVVDDNRRFPFHLWHFLSDYTGFGIGDLGRSEETPSPFWSRKGPAGLTIPSHGARIWWVDAESKKWRYQLRAVLKSLKKNPLRAFVIDVRGGESASSRRYSAAEVVRILLKDSSKDTLAEQLVLVSSYRTAPERVGVYGLLRVRTKSKDTFEHIRKRLVSRPGKAKVNRTPAALHLLVTGAGVEFEDHVLRNSCPLGMPTTARLLAEALKGRDEGKDEKVTLPQNKYKAAVEDGFPLPIAYASREKYPDLHTAAAEKQLDRYWNLLLEKEFERVSIGGRHTLAACERESELRERFRRRLLAFDWGHLPQTIEAAQLNWHAWLTTNYTRFADRALTVIPKIDQRRWEVIATSNEAGRLQRTLLHERARVKARERYLFKLHGDIAHLTTMAIAGYDKEFSTPLSFPVDSLHQVYLVAYLYLDQTLRQFAAQRDAKVIWHIVGHGLYDSLLVNILARLSEARPNQHLFLLVDPSFPNKKLKGESPADRLRAHIGSASRIHEIQLESVRYFARLRARNLLTFGFSKGKEWEEAVGPLS